MVWIRILFLNTFILKQSRCYLKCLSTTSPQSFPPKTDMKPNRKHYQDTDPRNKREKKISKQYHIESNTSHMNMKSNLVTYQNHLSTNEYSKCISANSPLSMKWSLTALTKQYNRPGRFCDASRAIQLPLCSPYSQAGTHSYLAFCRCGFLPLFFNMDMDRSVFIHMDVQRGRWGTVLHGSSPTSEKGKYNEGKPVNKETGNNISFSVQTGTVASLG